MAAITCDTSTAPSDVATLMLVSWAPGAMPWKRLPPNRVFGSLPAMMPAMWVPWPKVSRYRWSGDWLSNERSGPFTTLPEVSPLTGTTPVSTSATPTPFPVTPRL